ncbi:MAG: dual specificity protein phosphatase family protein [Patescibacteria group bacterium]|nr:dual specificity protein phosphatase family protein [Patescibacteria group bacterium]MDD5715083.1 dual specificity protein phosphatase family protein [Patescibacteria group bacterium]
MPNHGIKRHLEYSKIEKYIYIGTTICCKKHFNDLLKLGIRADIDLQEEKLDHPSGVELFLWLPTHDFTCPSILQLTIGSHFISQTVESKKKCYIHCKAGSGRAPVLVAAYYIMRYGISPEQAVHRINKKRPSVIPNLVQMRGLKKFYHMIHRHKV